MEHLVCLFNRFFDCNRWLAVDEEDGKVQVLLVMISPEQFAIECRKTDTKEIALANHEGYR